MPTSNPWSECLFGSCFKEGATFCVLLVHAASGLFLFLLCVMKMNVKHRFHAPRTPRPSVWSGHTQAEEFRGRSGQTWSAVSFLCRSVSDRQARPPATRLWHSVSHTNQWKQVGLEFHLQYGENDGLSEEQPVGISPHLTSGLSRDSNNLSSVSHASIQIQKLSLPYL